MARYTATALLSPPFRLATGAVRVEALIPSGVQRYGDVAEYIPPDELGSQAYMDGLAGLPVLWREGMHPDTPEGLVTVDDTGSAVKLGTILGARMEGSDQVVTMVLDHPDAERIAREYPYVSMGYRADRIAQRGTAPDGTPYTHLQHRRREANHIVTTHAPRAGDKALVRLDALDAEDTDTPATPEGDPMDEALAKLIAMIEALTAKVDALGAEEATEAEGEGAPPPRMDTIGDVVALQAAASDLGVALDPKATLAASRKAVAAKLAERGPVRLDTDDDAAQAIAVYAASRPSQAERIARGGNTRLDTAGADNLPPLTA